MRVLPKMPVIRREWFEILESYQQVNTVYESHIENLTSPFEIPLEHFQNQRHT
jgi:hypothetical protein